MGVTAIDRHNYPSTYIMDSFDIDNNLSCVDTNLSCADQEMKNKMIGGLTKTPCARVREVIKRRTTPAGTKKTRVAALEMSFNVGAIKQCNLVKGTKVDIYYDRYNKIWNRPVLIIKKGGTQRVLSGPIIPYFMSVSITAAVKEFDIPVPLRRRLEILDYCDGEIYIDITDAGGEEIREEKKRERLNARLTYTNGKGSSRAFKVTRQLKDRVKAASINQDKPMNQIIVAALERYLDEEGL